MTRGCPWWSAILLGICPVLGVPNSYDAMVQRYEKKIAEQDRQLRYLNSLLSKKMAEAQRWEAKAGDAKREWESTQSYLSKAQEEVQSAHRRWTATRASAEAAQWQLAQRTSVHEAGVAQVSRWVRVVDRARKGSGGLWRGGSTALVHASALVRALTGVTAQAGIDRTVAQQQEESFRRQAARWEAEESKAREASDRWRNRQNEFWRKWQDALRRRQALMDEKMEIEQSAEALRVMLGQLRESRDRAAVAQTIQARDQRVSMPIARGSLPWPVSGRVIQEFGKQRGGEPNRLTISNGVRLEAAAGQSVRAIQRGQVLFANVFRDYGQLVIIQHAGGLTSVYAGLGEKSVKEGQWVEPLDTVGVLGPKGSFYFELRHHETPINPLVWLTPKHSAISSRRKGP